MEILRDFQVVVGTYEEFLLGFQVTSEKKGPPLLHPTFSDHAHAGGAVRAIGAEGKFLASGAADENVRIVNLRKRTHHGDLRNLHQDTVTQIVFYDRAHLVTAADDGKICILRTKDFQVEKTLSKHSGGVTCLSIHPSGKMALSVGKDHKLITWNLIKGRSAYVTNVKEVSDLVRWSPDGERYLVAFRGRVDVYRTDTAKVENAIRLDGTSGNGRANEIAFLDRDTAVVAGDFPEVEIHCLEGKRLLHKFAAHEKRVRCLHVQKGPGEDHFSLVTASNDGLIKVWRLHRSGREEFEVDCVASKDTECRITCMAVHKVPEVVGAGTDSIQGGRKGKKRKKGKKQQGDKGESKSAKKND